jgi:hypothetical protein
VSTSILVAPREIVDLVYRASRVTGVDSGVASILGRSACFACGQLGSQLDNVAEPLASRTSPPLGFSSVALAEVEAIRSSAAEVELDTTLTVADLAYSALRAGQRGTSISMKGSDGVLHTPHDWLSAGRAGIVVVGLIATTAPLDPGVVGRVKTRHAQALRDGISISLQNWKSVGELARDYLVEESIIDAAESAPSI